MSNFVSLEDAAKKLGVSTDELVEMRSRGEIFGYRDGGSWKFKPEEIERVAAEMMGGDALDEDPAGSSILVSDSTSKHGSTIGSDLKLSDDAADVDSDVSLVADPGSGSDVRLVASQDDDELKLADSDDDDDELALAPDDADDMLAAASSAAGGSDASDVPLSDSDASGILNLDPGASDIALGDSNPAVDSGSLDLQGSDLELSDDGDLVLGGGSDLALGSDSGINLMSPADSGISLEDEPLDLAASGISGLDLASEGSDVGSGSGSGVDFQQDEEFQLSPSGSLDADDDSGSQVIELEDSAEFGDQAVASAEEGFDAFADVDGGGGLEESTDAFGETEAAPAGGAVMGSPEVPYTTMQVLLLLGLLLLMCMSGILVTDVVRNMWAWSGDESTLTSGFTSMVLSAFGQ